MGDALETEYVSRWKMENGSRSFKRRDFHAEKDRGGSGSEFVSPRIRKEGLKPSARQGKEERRRESLETNKEDRSNSRAPLQEEGEVAFKKKSRAGGGTRERKPTKEVAKLRRQGSERGFTARQKCG